LLANLPPLPPMLQEAAVAGPPLMMPFQLQMMAELSKQQQSVIPPCLPARRRLRGGGGWWWLVGQSYTCLTRTRACVRFVAMHAV
jgi:hypothetical protein